MSLKYVAAYMMATLSGKESPQESDVTNILESIGAEVEPEVVASLVSQLTGKSVHEVIAAGMTKLQSVSTGPAGGGAGGAAAGGEEAAEEEAAVEEEKAEEPEEEEEEDLGFGLFD